jgi:DUF4097 and DUF4098 domain-containing protein YvlB
MKKFTKRCLMTALVIFIIGCVFCIFGFVLGGFSTEPWTTGWEMTNLVNGDDGEMLSTVAEEQLDLTAETLKNIDVEIGACGLVMHETDEDHVGIAVTGNDSTLFGNKIRYRVENGDTLVVERTASAWDGWRSLMRKKDRSDAVVYLNLPKNVSLETVDIEFGAGEMTVADLSADYIDIECGAGACTVDSLQAEVLSLSVGAGQADIGSLKANECELEVGVGELVVRDAEITGNLDIDVGLGNAEVGGSVTGDMEADCGMGNLTMALTGSEDAHSYDAECAMGSVVIGGRSYSGVAEAGWGSADSHFEIACSMGNVVISFDQTE